MLQAPAQNPGPSMGLLLIWYVVGFGAIYYFFFVRHHRKQQQAHKDLVASLQKGDQVVTNAGLVGEVVFQKDDQVTIKSGEAKLVVLRTSIAQVLNRPAAEAKTA